MLLKLLSNSWKQECQIQTGTKQVTNSNKKNQQVPKTPKKYKKFPNVPKITKTACNWVKIDNNKKLRIGSLKKGHGNIKSCWENSQWRVAWCEEVVLLTGVDLFTGLVVNNPGFWAAQGSVCSNPGPMHHWGQFWIPIPGTVDCSRSTDSDAATSLTDFTRWAVVAQSYW